jgi:hypothetical protein
MLTAATECPVIVDGASVGPDLHVRFLWWAVPVDLGDGVRPQFGERQPPLAADRPDRLGRVPVHGETQVADRGLAVP